MPVQPAPAVPGGLAALGDPVLVAAEEDGAAAGEVAEAAGGADDLMR